MTALQKITDFIKQYPDFSMLSAFAVDYTKAAPANGGIFPGGLREISRERDVCGNTVATNQYSFDLYCVFAKASGDDQGAEENAEWIAGLQEWVQNQSVRGCAPAFGDDSFEESMTAQNGALVEANDGTATYVVQMSVKFQKIHEVS